MRKYSYEVYLDILSNYFYNAPKFEIKSGMHDQLANNENYEQYSNTDFTSVKQFIKISFESYAIVLEEEEQLIYDFEQKIVDKYF